MIRANAPSQYIGHQKILQDNVADEKWSAAMLSTKKDPEDFGREKMLQNCQPSKMIKSATKIIRGKATFKKTTRECRAWIFLWECWNIQMLWKNSTPQKWWKILRDCIKSPESATKIKENLEKKQPENQAARGARISARFSSRLLNAALSSALGSRRASRHSSPVLSGRPSARPSWSRLSALGSALSAQPSASALDSARGSAEGRIATNRRPAKGGFDRAQSLLSNMFSFEIVFFFECVFCELFGARCARKKENRVYYYFAHVFQILTPVST